MAVPRGRRSRTSGAGRSAASTRAPQRRAPRRPVGDADRVPARGRRRAATSRCACASCTSSRAASRARGDGARAGRRAEVGGERHVAWDEAVEREVELRGDRRSSACSPAPRGDRRAGRRRARRRCATRRARGGCVRAAGSALAGAVEVAAERARRERFTALTVRDRRTRPRSAGGRARRRCAQTFCSTHTVLRAGRRRVRLAHRPAGGAARAGRRPARTTGTWPVLVGDAGRARHDALLADHPAGPPADRAREPGRPVRRRRDRPAAAC